MREEFKESFRRRVNNVHTKKANADEIRKRDEWLSNHFLEIVYNYQNMLMLQLKIVRKPMIRVFILVKYK